MGVMEVTGATVVMVGIIDLLDRHRDGFPIARPDASAAITVPSMQRRPSHDGSMMLPCPQGKPVSARELKSATAICSLYCFG
jgi:hypothetical protein